jgi:shikimate dehydrogenase
VADRPTGHTTVAAVIGTPVRHSLSPAIHNAGFEALGLDWVFVAFDVAPGAAPGALAAMRTLALGGLSVTMPHKSAVAQALDDLSPAAAALDAVNCVVPRDGRLVGENTDGAGFLDGLSVTHGFDPDGKRTVVLGAGGAGRAVVRALAEAGAADIVVVNRSPDRAAEAAALAGRRGRVAGPDAVAEADLVVQATPLGMSPHDRLPADPARLAAGQLVVDLIYAPASTAFLQAAASHGARIGNGLPMLVHQAAHAFRLWTGCEPPIAAMTAAAQARAGAGA